MWGYICLRNRPKYTQNIPFQSWMNVLSKNVVLYSHLLLKIFGFGANTDFWASKFAGFWKVEHACEAISIWKIVQNTPKIRHFKAEWMYCRKIYYFIAIYYSKISVLGPIPTFGDQNSPIFEKFDMHVGLYLFEKSSKIHPKYTISKMNECTFEKYITL